LGTGTDREKLNRLSMHVESLINNPTEAKVFRKVVKEIKVKKSM
jgi:hypothetical protein